jgi:ankyrin repeat protein
MRECEAVVQMLLEKGTEVDTKDSSGRTPLSLAAICGYKTVIQLLLEKGL